MSGKIWDVIWAVWFGLFVIMDLVLIATGHKEYTLSWRIWDAEGDGWSAFHYLIAAFMLWATLHLVFRIFT